MPYYDIYDENDNLISSDVWINDGYYGSSSTGPIEKGFGKTVLLNSMLIISAILFIILPLLFIFLTVPSCDGIWNALLQDSTMVVLWIFSIINIIIQINRKVFVHRLYHSQKEKYKRMRIDVGISKNDSSNSYSSTSIVEEETQTEDVDKNNVYVEQIKHPMSRFLRKLRISLIVVFLVMMIVKVIFQNSLKEGYDLAFVGPLFAYSYILDFVCVYVMYGKKGNLLWLGLIISVFICSLTLEVSFLRNVSEYILFISMMLCNLLFFKKFDK